MSAQHGQGSDLEVLEERAGRSELEQRLRVPADLGCLEGHFPGLPILPGIAQLRWAVGAGSRLLGRPLAPSRIEGLKFREVIGPGEEVLARAELAPEEGVLRFSIARGARTVSSARFVLAAGDALGRAAPVEGRAEPRPCAELVPQSGPMLFLDRLLATNEERTVCRVRIHDRPFFRDDDGCLPGWAGLEPMAQCVAAHGGVHAPAGAGARPPIGFLLGCRRLEVRAERLSPDVAYAAAAVRLWGGATGLVSFDCELFEIETGERLLAGRINAYLPEDPSAVVEGRL